jgi:hypothetical protein
MFIQTLSTHRDNPKPVQVSWEELVQFLIDVERVDTPKNDLPCWVPAKIRGFRRITSAVEEVSALVLDFDDLTVEQWAEVRERLAGLSYVYHSTYSFQPISGCLCYRVCVQLDKPVPGNLWKRFFKIATDMLGGKNDEKCSDASRLFYCPRCPVDGPEPDSGVGEGFALPTDEILAQISQATPAAVVVTDGACTHAMLASVLPKRIDLIDNENVRDAWFGVQAALDNRPFAVTGKRDSTLLYMSGVLAGAFPTHTAVSIVAPIAAALDLEDDEPGWAPRALIEKLERDLVKEREKIAAKQNAPSRQVGGRVYTREELEQYAKDLRLSSVEELTGQLIVNVGADYYVFWNGEYLWLGAKDRAEGPLISRLAAAAGPLPVITGEETAKGFQYKGIKQLMAQYGKHLYKIRKDLRLQHSYIDIEADTFNYAICRRDATLQPVRSPGVQMWLESWEEPRIIDWCATAGKLEHATACLILDGEPRTGKTQFAKAVASMWGASPTPLRDLTASFNDALSRCPVVYAEESIPWEFRRDTGLIKELITADHQQLRQKYQDNAELAGSLRLIIARNDHKLFEAGEVLTKGTINALSDRMLYVYTGRTPAPHFESREIAQHFLWLEKNHEVRPSNRGGMWVTGVPSRLHYRMRAFTSKVSISVCQWLLNFIDKPVMCGDTSGANFRLDSTGLHVSPKLVCDKWVVYCGNEARQPTMAQVSEALGGIADVKGRLYKIDLNVLAEYAESVLWTHSTPDALQSAIESSGANMARSAN